MITAAMAASSARWPFARLAVPRRVSIARAPLVDQRAPGRTQSWSRNGDALFEALDEDFNSESNFSPTQVQSFRTIKYLEEKTLSAKVRFEKFLAN